MATASLERHEPRVARELGPRDRVTEPPPIGVVARRDRDPLVVARSRIDAVRRHRRMIVGDTIQRAPVDLRVEQVRREELERALDLRLIDVLPVARAPAMIERGEDHGDGEARRDEVGVGTERAARRAIGPAGRRHQPAERGAHGAVARHASRADPTGRRDRSRP